MRAKDFLREEKELLPDVDTFTVPQLAKLHGVSKKKINDQLKMGIEVEYEHTKNKDLAREIALDHLKEMPDYYTQLSKMEKGEISEMTSAGSVAAVAMPLGPVQKRKKKKNESKSNKYMNSVKIRNSHEK